MVIALGQSAMTTICLASNAELSLQGNIGIRLLDAPVSRQDDPRAKSYIVDHLAPGTTISRRVEVTNATDTAQSIDLYPGAAAVHDNKFTFADGKTPNELSKWMSVDQTRVTVAANGDATVTATIQVPASASAGERYGVIWAQVTAPPSPASTIGMVSRVGIRVYLDVGAGGEPRSDFEIGGMTTARGPDGRPEVRADVHNTGQRTLDMSGSLILSDGPGSLSTGPFDVTAGTTLAPEASASVSVVLDSQLPIGPWSASLTLRSGLIDRTVNATITFPDQTGRGGSVDVSGWSWLGVVAIALLVLATAVVLATALRRRAIRRRQRV